MDVKYKIFKRKAGKSKDKWIVRIEYFDDVKGKKAIIERQADKRSDVADLKNKLVDDVKKSHGQIQTGERITFQQLADISEKNFYKPAEIVQGRKIAGIRSIVTVKGQIKKLCEFFGNRLIKDITTESITDYKLWRLSTNSKLLGRPVKITTVNRELSVMRKIMRFAYGKGWILKEIFYNAKVIDVSAEIERKRLLSPDEEKRLLASCHGEREVTYKRKWKGKEQEITATVSVDNPHLKGMIILAIDSGMRRGEIFKLRWQDIDFDNNSILILGTHTKTERERIAPLSQRAKDELNNLKAITKGTNPFPYTDIKRSFATAKRIAGIDNLQFRDLRRTAVTRWLQQGTSLAFAGKFAGHSQLQTTMKHYTATDNEMIRELNEKVNNYNSKVETEKQASEFIN